MPPTKGTHASKARHSAAELAFSAIVGQNIRRLRKAQGLTLAVVGDDLGIHGNSLSRFENAGRPLTAARLCLIADALDVPLAEIVTADAREALRATIGTGPISRVYRAEQARRQARRAEG